MHGAGGVNRTVQICGSENTMRPTGKATSKRLRQLLEYQEYMCSLTGVELEPETTEADHIVPRSLGGLNTIENIQLVTKQANRAKGTMPNDEFIELCRQVAAWNE